MKSTKKMLSILLAALIIFSSSAVAIPVIAANDVSLITDGNVSDSTDSSDDSEIVSEIFDKREENTKHFLLSDGSFVVAQYNNPVHYQNAAGDWIDIDNTITKVEATTEQTELFGTDDIYSTKKTIDNVVFAEKSNSNTLVSYEAKSYPISFNYHSIKKSNIKIVENNTERKGNDAFLTLPNIVQEVLYEDVFDGVDLQYIVSPLEIKENIILKNKRAQNSFTVNYNIGELTAEVDDKQTIRLMAGNEHIYTISAPCMYDAKGEKSEAVTLSVDKNKNGKLSISIIADEAWLQTEERAYPVVVDPSIFTESDDSIRGINEQGALTASGEISLSPSAVLDIGIVSSNADFDHVASAKLHLPVASVLENTQVNLYEINEAWKSENTVTKINPDCNSAIEDYEKVTMTSETMIFDITKLYTKWINSEPNYGVKLTNVGLDELSFSLSNATSPVITVNYMNTCGLDMMMPMTAFDMGSAGYVYVNNYSGNLVITRENDISTTGEEYPYDLSMTYNSLASEYENGSLWLPSYYSGFNAFFLYIAPDGTVKYFNKTKVVNTSDLYTLESNDYGWERIEVTQKQEVTLPIIGTTILMPIAFDAWKNNYTEKHSFNVAGLQEIVIGENLDRDEEQGKIIFSRETTDNPNAFYIVDGDEQKLLVQENTSFYSFTQQSTDESGNSVTGDNVTYTFDASGNVTHIKRNDAVEAEFTYNSDGTIQTIIDNSGHKLEFGYVPGSKKINAVTEWKNDVKGQTYSFERKASNVVMRTSGADGIYGNDDDRLTISRFSPELKLLGESYSTVSGEYLGAVSYERDEREEDAYGFDGINRIGVTGKSPDNLLKNHNIESETNWTKKAIVDTDADFTGSISNEVSYVGEKSLKVTAVDFTKGGAVGYTQSFTPSMNILETGKPYVASAYINASDFVKDADGWDGTSYGAFVMVETVTPSGAHRVYSNNIINTSNKWERAFVEFKVPADYTEISVALIVRNSAGTAYFDAAQLEKGDSPSEYNMLENHSFSYVSSSGTANNWTRDNLSSTDIVEDGRMKIIADSNTLKAVYQDVKLTDAQQDDTYTVSCWAEANPVALTHKDENATTNDLRQYAVHARVYYKDDAGNETYELIYNDEFNHYDNDRQFLSGSFSLKHPTDSTLKPSKIRIYLIYYHQCNTAYFDDAALYRSDDVYDLAQDAEDPYTYDESGRIDTYTNEEGVVYHYSYNDYGDVVSILNAQGNGDRFTYQVYEPDKTRILTESYEDGTVYSYEYHSGTDIKTETITTPNETAAPTVEVYTYDVNGNLILYSVDNIVKESYTYTVINGEYYVETETREDNIINYSYNSNGNILSKVKTVNGVETERDTYVYDSTGKNIVSHTYTEDVKTVVTQYNSNGDILSKVKTVNGVEAERDVYLYHQTQHYLTSHAHTVNGITFTTYYNSEGAVIKVLHNGFEYNYEYYAFGNAKSVKVGTQPLVSYSYLPDKSNLSGITYGNGDSESYAYNVYGQLRQKTVSGLGAATYSYDTSGRLNYEKDELSGRRTYLNYDTHGNLIKRQVNVNSVENILINSLYTSRNKYDTDGNMTRTVVTGKRDNATTHYDYNEETGLLDRVSMNVARTRNVEYGYENGIIKTKTITATTPIVNTYGYDDNGLISTHTIAATEGTGVYSYTYDENGNITEIKKNGVVQQSYVYDEANELIRENNRDINKSIVYTYDGYGNILNKKEYAFTTGSLGAVTDTINYTYDSVWKDKLTSYDGHNITYDSIGNPLAYRGATMTWNGRKLMSYTKGDDVITYQYDGNGLRTQKTVNGAVYNYYYEDGLLMHEIKEGAYELFYRYDGEGNLFSISRYRYSDENVIHMYAVNNTRGDVTELRLSDGTVYCRYVYDSWGRLISATNANGGSLGTGTLGYQNSVRYRGYVYDNETALYYLQSRYYDAETGRFLNADDVNYIGYSGEDISYNAFAYCENNAVNGVDKQGCVYEYIFAAILFYSVMLEIIKAFLINYIGVKDVLDFKSLERDGRTGLFTCRVKYTIQNNHWLNIKIGDKQAWAKSCISSNVVNNMSIDGLSTLADFSAGNLGDPDYSVDVMVIYLMVSLVGIYLTYFDADYKALMAQKVYGRIWGETGLDPKNQHSFFGVKISYAESEISGKSINGYYAFSAENKYGELIIR